MAKDLNDKGLTFSREHLQLVAEMPDVSLVDKEPVPIATALPCSDSLIVDASSVSKLRSNAICQT